MDEADEEGEWSDDVMDPLMNVNADNFASLEHSESRGGMFPHVQVGKKANEDKKGAKDGKGKDHKDKGESNQQRPLGNKVKRS